MIRSLGAALVTALALGLAWLMWMPNPAPQGLQPGAWEAYRSRFVSAEGRVIDTGNRNISHSEGQGIGMLLAVAGRDRAGFDLLWSWTRTHLRVREDALSAWRWEPNPGATSPTELNQAGTNKAATKVTDRNNASDGDIYIAWALLRAARLWGGDYAAQARDILGAVRTLLVRRQAGYTILLPGAYGFTDAQGITLNLSYWIFPALRDFAEFDPDPVWGQVEGSGIALLERARFGRWGLPPDWVVLTATGDLRLPESRPPRFGFDAVRIPLLLTWGRIDRAELYAPYQALQAGTGSWPGWVDLRSDTTAEYPASAGAEFVLGLTGSRQNRSRAVPNSLPGDLDYYGASLWLLGQLAVLETAG